MKKILLDENLPKKLKFRFGKEFEVLTVPDLQWNSLKNGELLQAMQENNFAVLITVHENLRFQQNLDKFNIIVIVLNAKDNRYETTLPFVKKIIYQIQKNQNEKYIWID